VGEKLDGGMGKIRRPKSNATVLVPKVYHGVMEVLGHGVTRTEFCPMLDDDLASAGVLIFEISGISLHSYEISSKGGIEKKLTMLARSQWYGRYSSLVGSICDFSRCSSTPSLS